MNELNELDEFELTILRDYLGSSWEKFKDFCAEFNDGDSSVANIIYTKLGDEDE